MSALNSETLDDLLQTAIASAQEQNRDLHREAIGALALLLGNLIRQGDSQLFRSGLRSIAQAVDDKSAKDLLKLVRQGLTPEQDDWLNAQIEAIMRGDDATAP